MRLPNARFKLKRASWDPYAYASSSELACGWEHRIGVAAEHLGARITWSPNAIWLPLMLVGAIPNLIYCLYLIGKNHTANRFGN